MILGFQEKEIVKFAVENGVVGYNYKTGELVANNNNAPVLTVFKLDDEVKNVDAYVEDNFEVIFEAEYRESLEEQISDVINDHVGELLDKYNTIRINVLDILNPAEYYNHRNDDWELRVIDSIVDMVIESGFTTETTPEAYLEGEYFNLINLVDESNNEKVTEVYCLLQEEKIDEAIEVLGGE